VDASDPRKRTILVVEDEPAILAGIRDNLELEDPNYASAGHFSRWVLETYGEQSYRALLNHPGSAREAFEATYSMSVEDAEALYYDEAPHSYAALISCGHPN
jgi:hypothetical protein